jgi:hypothetical protein
VPRIGDRIVIASCVALWRGCRPGLGAIRGLGACAIPAADPSAWAPGAAVTNARESLDDDDVSAALAQPPTSLPRLSASSVPGILHEHFLRCYGVGRGRVFRSGQAALVVRGWVARQTRVCVGVKAARDVRRSACATCRDRMPFVLIDG